MRAIKVKYYEEAEEGEQIVPLDPQPVKIKGEWVYDKTGSDEKGDYVVIDFLTEDPVYINYDSEKPTKVNSKELDIITEEEWNERIEIPDTESTDIMSLNDVVNANASTLRELITTNIKTSQQICSMVIGKLIQTIARPFSSVYSVIMSNFRR